MVTNSHYNFGGIKFFASLECWKFQAIQALFCFQITDDFSFVRKLHKTPSNGVNEVNCQSRIVNIESERECESARKKEKSGKHHQGINTV